ncbi:Transketolase [Pelotomaculum schinkii]|uniref:Transketolase n=1 Tax=Pelotomaculum schinkii TaxID=78350 RepID=A0A4Y7RGG0_9FIRM|nr:transketolase [Pelotomaculum schinkii]TEB07839.1 Transketolase [Pelotomaculum schinkii]
MNNVNQLDQLCINTIRVLAAEVVEKAKSGHPGMPMGSAPMAYVLWTKFLRHNPTNPSWTDRDRFVLSAGHGSALLYALLHLTGYDLPLEDLKEFRQWGSRTPGHPEYGQTPGVEVTTGPLGQGLSSAVGMAMAECFLAAHFNRPGFNIVDHYTYVISGDGDLMEGVTSEAASLAGHLKLGRLICLYDDNHIMNEGDTGLAFTEDRGKRFEAYGWQVLRVEDGNDIAALEAALEAALAEKEKPSLIMVRTYIGFGSPHKQGQVVAHGEPLGAEELKLTKENLGWPQEPPFYIPDQSLDHFRQAVEKGRSLEANWQDLFDSYTKSFPALAQEFHQWTSGRLPAGWDRNVPVFSPNEKGMATRDASGEFINAVSGSLSNLLGGSADLGPSNRTIIKGAGDFAAGHYQGRNLRFGVREHGMGSILNGMALHGGLIPYGATFLAFTDYMRPPMRLSAMMGLKVIYVFTHDSIAVGEDGPTHQPVEHLASLRIIPGLTVIRPADANETNEAWRAALTVKGPVALILPSQKLPVLDRQKFAAAGGLSRGAYTLNQAGNSTPDAIILASGSEVHLALQAAERLQKTGVAARVVSMPSWELFEQQPQEYHQAVLPPQVKARVAVEAGISQGWHRYTGASGEIISIDRFGASAPADTLFEKFGFTVENIVEKTLKAVQACKNAV